MDVQLITVVEFVSSISGNVAFILQDLLNVSLSAVCTMSDMHEIAQNCGEVRNCLTAEYLCLSNLSWSFNSSVCVIYSFHLKLNTHSRGQHAGKTRSSLEAVCFAAGDDQTRVRAAISCVI